MMALHPVVFTIVWNGGHGVGCRERVQKLEGEVASLRSSNKRLKAAESSWAEAEARAAAHAGAEEALRYQLNHLQNAVKASLFCVKLHIACMLMFWPPSWRFLLKEVLILSCR